MTRLFLRFYLGVIAILIAAWLIQTSVFRKSSIQENIPVIEDIYAGSGRLARDQIVDGGEDEFSETMEYLENQFDYPIRVVTRDERPMDQASTDRLDRGESILYYDRLETAIPDTPFLVELGPLPRFDEPSQAELSFALGGVFLLTAIGIAILLHPVSKQLRGVEKTALAIAGGDLGARIDYGRFRHSGPLAEAFNTMADRVEKLLRSQRELLQTVSHELRTPLARIRFATELIETADDDHQRKQRLTAIEAATDQLDALVGELLTYVRLDAQYSEPDSVSNKMETFDVRELVDELIELHGPLYRKIEFRNAIAMSGSDLSGSDLAGSDLSGSDLSGSDLAGSDLSGSDLSGDRAAISRAIGNLISNAGKYAASTVIVSAADSDHGLCIRIDDDGRGIAPEDREAVFEPFQRLAGGTDPKADQPGTGLGLALVKRIAERNGGRVSVTESELGGARFSLTLPNDADLNTI
ncbi:Sensor protein RstB [Stieleria neptunia]|uniref:histidine kinase n=1 Tax=Stieleria neptunia TaxID=2527979 RepID=A0A518HZQ0_9BACT|nr:ATP-binding protein [Stieleria neptunia]QDV46267.1 Sensor protein RstB [Stieleria neptunia]